MKLLDNELEELSVKKNIEEMSLKKLPECFSIISKAIKLNEDILKRHSNIIRTASEIANSSAVIKAMKANRDLMRVADEIANSSTVIEAMKANRDLMRVADEIANSSTVIEAIKVNRDLIRVVGEITNSSAAIKAMKANRDLMRVESEIVSSTPLDIDEINGKKILKERKDVLIPLSNEALIEKEKKNNNYVMLLNYYILFFSFFFLERYKKLGKVVEKIHKTKKESQFKYSRKDISIYKKSNGKTVKDILTGKKVVICEEIKGKYCRITYKNFEEQEEGWVKKSWLKNVDESKI